MKIKGLKPKWNVEFSDCRKKANMTVCFDDIQNGHNIDASSNFVMIFVNKHYQIFFKVRMG